MTIIQLKCFAEVAKGLNFAKAARELYISQPAVSQHIHALEDELGVKLFVRIGKSVTLSAAGELFLQDASDILNRIEQSTRRISLLENSETLNLGYSPQLVIPDFHEILRRYHEKMPGVEINLFNCTLNNVNRLFADERIDAVFASKDLAPLIPGLPFKRISRSQMYCIVPPEHRLAGKASVGFEDINGEHIIMLNDRNSPPAMSRVLRSVRERCNDIVVHFSDSAALTVNMVAAGLGIAIMPGFVITDRSIVKPVPFSLPEQMVQPFEVGIFYNPGDTSQKLRELIGMF